MAIALAREALVGTDDVRTYLQLASDDEPSDDLLKQIINGLSQQIKNRTGEVYVSPSSTDASSARTFQHVGDGRQILIDNARQISLVEATNDPNGDWTTIEPEDYVAEPYGESITTSIRTDLELPAENRGWEILGRTNNRAILIGDTQWPREEAAEASQRTYVRVTAKWGYGASNTSIPDNVRLAILMWLQNIHKRDQAFFSEDLAKVAAEMAVPADVVEMLDGESATASNASAI